jgi:CheY-like chemotaxis protein
MPPCNQWTHLTFASFLSSTISTDVMGSICQSALVSFRNRSKNDGVQIKELKDAVGPVPIRISDFVKSIYMVIEPFPKKVPLVITVHPSVPESIIADDLKLFRSAVNFLTNACAKTETGSVHLSLYIKDDKRSCRKLFFECEDTGPGVPVEKYPHLFRPFRDESEQQEEVSCLQPTADGSFASISKIQLPNSGLGLYSIAVHISSIGGQYGFRPRGGDSPLPAHAKRIISGSIFWFSIPLIVPDTSTVTARDNQRNFDHLNGSFDGDDVRRDKMVKVLSTPNISQEDANNLYITFTKVLEGGDTPTGIENSTPVAVEQAKKAPKLAVPVTPGEPRKRRALVIEDSLVVRKSLTRVLTKLGFEAVQAVDGMEGLKELKGSLFDVVLCDFLMPVMDGLDCVQQYREWETAHRSCFRQRIIGISAHANEKDIAKGREVGMDDFKPKPVTYKQIEEMQESEELKIVGAQLDEIAAQGAVMDSEEDEKVAPSETPRQSAAKLDADQTEKSTTTSTHVCLIAAESGSSDTMIAEKVAKKKGWETVVVQNGEDALRLLKTRNWDAVLLDEDLPVLSCSQCVSRFREWEDLNRVTRQKNVVLVSTSCVSMTSGSNSMVQLPFGFDCSLGKPVRIIQLELLLNGAERSDMDFGVRDIVSR